MLRPKVAQRPSVTLKRRGSSCSSIGTAPIRLRAIDGASRHSAYITRGAGDDEHDDADDDGERHPAQRAEQQRGNDGRTPRTSVMARRRLAATSAGKTWGAPRLGCDIERLERRGWRQRDGGPRRPAAARAGARARTGCRRLCPARPCARRCPPPPWPLPLRCPLAGTAARCRRRCGRLPPPDRRRRSTAAAGRRPVAIAVAVPVAVPVAVAPAAAAAARRHSPPDPGRRRRRRDGSPHPRC